MKYFDAHSHYHDRKFSKDRHELLDKLQRSDVAYVVDCFGMDKLNFGLSLAKKYPFYYICINAHGWEKILDQYAKEDFDIKKHGPLVDAPIDEAVATLKNLCKENKKIVAYGECYIDFRKTEKTPAEVAKRSFVFSKDLEIARRVGLPPVIHSGNADNESFEIIKKADMPDYGHGKGMMHCYLGPPKMALDYIDMGYLISITGLVTHRSAHGKNLVEVVKRIPLSHMIIETDCPYLTPEPFRHKRNDSGLLRLTIEAIAELKNVSPQEVAEITTSNAKALYKIK
ncbi:MAG: TatD family hydrolase [Defluviitaleaceae bacterium]|nr:TatD family hydrolase [Defluviitaleaceae bacterium]